ncbi:MAG: 16S rRNA (guanine(527)-N(7))-methyltransferase RsmG [Tannerella sp.]|jgi:16S rRNA (guanine527-N7)-methyltransferase|nr:16S rRNA (guanine(527)-N(7))-methyltransferase RsmG [Tannerella sp.]
MEVIGRYYPNLSDRQLQQFASLEKSYADWNAKINVISRKDIENLCVNHVLHSLGIEKMLRFSPGSSVMDVGTGGGFPGIPLAILFPEVSFHLIDGTGKKIRVAQAVADAAGLTNVTTRHCRVEEEKARFDFIVSRAVMPLSDLAKLVRKNIRAEQINALPNGLICLKGGNLQSELTPFRKHVISIDLSDYYKEPFFEMKKVIYLPL